LRRNYAQVVNESSELQSSLQLDSEQDKATTTGKRKRETAVTDIRNEFPPPSRPNLSTSPFPPIAYTFYQPSVSNRKRKLRHLEYYLMNILHQQLFSYRSNFYPLPASKAARVDDTSFTFRTFDGHVIYFRSNIRRDITPYTTIDNTLPTTSPSPSTIFLPNLPPLLPPATISHSNDLPPTTATVQSPPPHITQAICLHNLQQQPHSIVAHRNQHHPEEEIDEEVSQILETASRTLPSSPITSPPGHQ